MARKKKEDQVKVVKRRATENTKNNNESSADEKKEMSESDPLLVNGRTKKEKITPVQYYHNENVGWRLRRQRQKDVKEYYRKMDELNELYEQDVQLMEGNEAPAEIERAPDRILAKLSFCLSITLLFTNLTASIMSGSLAIVSTFIDSFMDVTSSVIIGICLFLINNTNKFHYPRGRGRLELLGVIFCSVIMGIANMGVIMQSVTQILSGQIEPELDLVVFSMMLGGSAVKSVLMVVCYKRGTSSSLVLAMDMRNDLCTTAVAIVSAYIGYHYWPYADPVGAISVCGIIAINWFHHAVEHVPQLVGVRAERENLSRILKIAIEHDERIKYIDHVMVYHTGLEAIVELHIVMDENLPLKITHDISHPLEKKLLKLDFVERAFVHCDYDCDGD